MKKRIIFSLPGNEDLTQKLSKQLQIEIGIVMVQHFPDREFYVRVETEVSEAEVMLVSTLNYPDDKLLPLYFLSKTLKELGAAKITLIAPYLPYTRQDKSYQTGEAITSNLFAKLISGFADEIITLDTRLHRRKNLSDKYSIPVKVLHVAPLISKWIKENVVKPLIIGPYEETEEWVSEVANKADAPFIVFKKTQNNDGNMQIEIPDATHWKNYKPVIVDDIIATARTMYETTMQLKLSGYNLPIAIGVHGIFVGTSELSLFSTGAEIITTNAIPHHTNRIDISELIADALQN
jgi:ribose-phosphate pyrophosphokinase